MSLELVRDGAIATLAIDRAAVHNAFDDALIGELTAALEGIAAQSDVRVLVLTGRGASFSAGADLGWMQRMAAADEATNHADALALARLMRVLDELPQATIARVNGPAYGGGVGLIACCDIAVGCDSARFGLTETRLGLVPAVISPYVLRAIGARWSRRLFLTAEIFDAARAADIGLLHEVVPADQLDATVARLARQLLRAGPAAVREAKALVRRIADLADPDARDNTNAALIARLRVSAEGQEGIGAFLGKRDPAW
jgi:methylglutaconyl-CoA hydratase